MEPSDESKKNINYWCIFKPLSDQHLISPNIYFSIIQ